MKKITFSALLLASAVCFAQPAALLESAKQGDASAQSNLGVMLKEGRGVAKNDAEAVRWFRRAAEQGNASAQFNLGAMLIQGQGVAQNDAEAVQWFRRAAQQGDASAQSNLGAMLAQGEGVAQNDEQAYFWFLLAGAHLEQGRAGRNFVQKRLSASQVTKLQAQAAAWKPKKEPQP